MPTRQPRVPQGTPTGGRFAATARSEVSGGTGALAADQPSPDTWQFPPNRPRVTAMTAYDDEAGWWVVGDEPVRRSADQPSPDTWQFPPNQPRVTAMTAYDDEAGWWVVGDELKVVSRNPVGHRWVDESLRVLGSLRLSGLTGMLHASIGWDDGWGYGQWRGVLTTPEGLRLDVQSEVGATRTWLTVSGFAGVARHVAADRDCGALDQGAVDQAVEDVARAQAVICRWHRHLGADAWKGRARHIPSPTQPCGEYDVVISPAGTANSTIVRFTAGAEPQLLAEIGRDGTWTKVDNARAAAAALGRRIGFRGGIRAGVPQRVADLLRQASMTDDEPSVRALLQRRNQARAAATA